MKTVTFFPCCISKSNGVARCVRVRAICSAGSLRGPTAISQICRLLHGLPLGIELAAAQLRCHCCDELLQLLTVNALTAAGSVLIPLQCEYYALEGLTELLNTIADEAPLT